MAPLTAHSGKELAEVARGAEVFFLMMTLEYLRREMLATARLRFVGLSPSNEGGSNFDVNVILVTAAPTFVTLVLSRSRFSL